MQASDYFFKNQRKLILGGKMSSSNFQDGALLGEDSVRMTLEEY